MSYILKINGVEEAKSNYWNASLFSRITGTSFPRQVEQSFIWESGEYWLGWEDDIEPTPTPTTEEIIANYTERIQQRLDTFANTRNYDGILSACTYATSNVPKFAAEGQYCVDIRDTTWATSYQILDDVLSGLRPMPTIDELFTELPELIWPN